MANFRIHIDADLSLSEYDFIMRLGKGDMQAGLKRVLIEGHGEFSEDSGARPTRTLVIEGEAH